MKKILGMILLGMTLLLLPLPASTQQEHRVPALEDPDSWTMVFIPDTQNYVKFYRNQPILDMIMAWIVENVDAMNIKMVLCPGDLVEQNNRINHGKSGNVSSQKQWEFVSQSFSRLDGRVPYITSTGNHDYSYDTYGVKTSRFREFFDIDKNFLNRKMICQNTLNAEGIPTLENAAFEMTAPGGDKFLFLSLEFAPRDTVVTWAANVAGMDQYRDHKVVLLTHEYLNRQSRRTGSKVKMVTEYNDYRVDGDIIKRKQQLYDSNNGEQLWGKLVGPSRNIELVMCGHISGTGFRVDRNAAGRKVNQMLFDAQSEGGGHYGSGGDGWIRILEFLPDGKTVRVRTFSPLFAVSPTTRHMAWRTDEANEFTFTFE